MVEKSWYISSLLAGQVRIRGRDITGTPVYIIILGFFFSFLFFLLFFLFFFFSLPKTVVILLRILTNASFRVQEGIEYLCRLVLGDKISGRFFISGVTLLPGHCHLSPVTCHWLGYRLFMPCIYTVFFY
jgi:hypothetical protein